MSGEGAPGPGAGGAASPPAPVPSRGAAPGEESHLLNWGAGGAVFAACADLLVAVLLGLLEPSAAEAGRFTVRDLGLAVGAAGLVSFGFAAAAWRGGPRGLVAAAIFHAAVAGGGWLVGGGIPGGVPRFYLAVLAVHALAGGAALAAAAAAPQRERRAPFAAAARAGAENLESILVAIVFALAIRHFAVEAYKIPTKSMEPTLLGDVGSRGPGDRVLVAKWTALFGGPERWQIWVFRPPLDRTINYVKRVAGLGGETVEIADGDLYVDGEIARKPPKTREAMWFPVWPREDPAAGRATGEARGAAPPWAGEGFRKQGEDGFRVSGATARRLLRYEAPIRDDVYDRRGSNDVGDVRLRFEVEDPEPDTVLVARITGRGGPCEARIPVWGDAGSTVVAGGDVTGATAGRASPVREMEVAFADLRFTVRLDGEEFLGRDAAALPKEGKRPAFGVAFGVEKGGATFRNVRLDRDVFYTGAHRFAVPEGHCLFLGDNSGQSSDARAWRGYEFREAAPGGRVFYAEAKPYGLDREGRVTFKDRNGVVRSYLPDEVAISEGSVPMSFVPAADLHGRAFAVFWPPRWFTKVAGGRVGLLP